MINENVRGATTNNYKPLNTKHITKIDKSEKME